MADNTATDHEEIRRWAERGTLCQPSFARLPRGTLRNLPMRPARLRPREELEEVSWDEFFQIFEDNGLAVVYQDEAGSGEQSNFSKLVFR